MGWEMGMGKWGMGCWIFGARVTALADGTGPRVASSCQADLALRLQGECRADDGDERRWAPPPSGVKEASPP